MTSSHGRFHLGGSAAGISSYPVLAPEPSSHRSQLIYDQLHLLSKSSSAHSLYIAPADRSSVDSINMAFLFKSKKHQSTALPPATRNVHTSDGTNSSSTLSNGLREKDREREGGPVQTPTPSSSVNNSLNSLGGGGGGNSPENQWNRRERSESESQVRLTFIAILGSGHVSAFIYLKQSISLCLHS